MGNQTGRAFLPNREERLSVRGGLAKFVLPSSRIVAILSSSAGMYEGKRAVSFIVGIPI